MIERSWSEILSSPVLGPWMKSLITARLMGTPLPEIPEELLKEGIARPVYRMACPACGSINTGVTSETVCPQCGEELTIELLGYTMDQEAYGSLKDTLSFKRDGITVIPLTVAPSRPPDTGVVVNISPVVEVSALRCIDHSRLSVFVLPWEKASELLDDTDAVLREVLSLRSDIVSRLVAYRTQYGSNITPLLVAYLRHIRRSVRIRGESAVMGRKKYLIHPLAEVDWRNIAAVAFRAERNGFSGIVALVRQPHHLEFLREKLRYTHTENIFVTPSDLTDAALASRSVLTSLKPTENILESFNISEQ